MYVIGLTLEKDAFRIAVLKKEKKIVAVDSLEAFSYGKDNVKQFYNLPPFHTGKEVQVVSGLPGTETFIRKLHLPLKEKRKILSALPFQLESLIPFASENPIVCALLKKISHQMTAVTVIATAELHLAAHIAALKEMDIEPDAVSCSAIALTRFAKWQFPQEQRILCFDVQDQKISSALIEDGELALSQTIHLDGKQEVSIELEKFSVYLKQKGAIEDSTPWLLTGIHRGVQKLANDNVGASDLRQAQPLAKQGLCKHKLDAASCKDEDADEVSGQLLNHDVYKSAEVNGIIKKIFPGPCLELGESKLGQFAVAIGLALDRAADDSGSVQFLQKKYTPARTHAQRKKKLIHFLGACFIAALLISVGGAIGLHMKQRHLVKKIASYFPASIDKDSISSVDQIEKKLREWENSTRGQKNSFAFLPTVPRVSDFLAWISAHPSFATEDGGQKEGTEIKSVHYSLTKYPKIGEPSSPYSAQVEIEFTSLVPRSARDFHESLLKGDQMVNAKKEIKWQTQNQTYYTSFELNKAGGS